MIDDKELEYSQSPLAAFTYFPSILLCAIFILFFFAIAAQTLAGGNVFGFICTGPILLGIAAVFGIPTYVLQKNRDISSAKMAQLKSMCSKMSSQERQNSFLQKYYTTLVWNRMGLGTPLPNYYPSWINTARYIVGYRVVSLSKGSIKIYELVGNNAQPVQREFMRAEISSIQRVESSIAPELIFVFKAKGGGEEKIYTNSTNFMDFGAFDSTVKSFYGDKIESKKAII